MEALVQFDQQTAVVLADRDAAVKDAVRADLVQFFQEMPGLKVDGFVAFFEFVQFFNHCDRNHHVVFFKLMEAGTVVKDDIGVENEDFHGFWGHRGPPDIQCLCCRNAHNKSITLKNMKTVWALIFFVMCGISPVFAADKPWALPEKERVVFKIKWLGITAGEIVSEIKGITECRGRKAYRIEVTARTVGLCSKLYRVEDKYVSFLDVERLHSLRHEVHRREGGYKKDAVIDFDQDKHRAYFKSATDGSEKSFSIPLDTQDTVTAVYVARTFDLQPGKRFDIKVCNSEKNYTIDLAIANKTKMYSPGKGLVDVVRLQPKAHLKNNVVRDGRLSGYVEVAPGHAPVFIIIKAPVFTRLTAVRI